MQIAWIFLMVWMLATSPFTRVIHAQAGIDPSFSPEVERYITARTCNEKLMLPLTSLIYVNSLTWEYMCGLNYFDTCRASFSARCYETNCSRSVDDYLRWVDAIGLGGAPYTCGVGWQTVAEVSLNGGSECVMSPGNDIFRKVIALDSYLWTAANPISCGQMEILIKDVQQAIRVCNDKNLMILIDGYFRTVIGSSPCAKTINYSSVNSSSHTISSYLTLAFLIITSIIGNLG